MMYNLVKQCNGGWKMTPVSPVFTRIFSLPSGWWFHRKMKNQRHSLYSPSWLAGLCCTCKRQVMLVHADWLTVLWLASANNRVSASHTVSRLELELRRTSLLHCNFPCNRLVSVQTGLKRERQQTEWRTNKRLQRVCFPKSLMLRLTLAC